MELGKFRDNEFFRYNHSLKKHIKSRVNKKLCKHTVFGVYDEILIQTWKQQDYVWEWSFEYGMRVRKSVYSIHIRDCVNGYGKLPFNFLVDYSLQHIYNIKRHILFIRN